MEHSKASKIGSANNNSRIEAKRQCRPGTKLGSMVEERTDNSILRWVCLWDALIIH